MTKVCYGNMGSQQCRANGGQSDCSDCGSCFLQSNIEHGDCECEIKSSCPPPMQQREHNLGNDVSKECKIYKMLKN